MGDLRIEIQAPVFKTVRANEKKKLSHGGRSQRQTSGIDPPMKALSQCHQSMSLRPDPPWCN